MKDTEKYWDECWSQKLLHIQVLLLRTVSHDSSLHEVKDQNTFNRCHILKTHRCTNIYGMSRMHFHDSAMHCTTSAVLRHISIYTIIQAIRTHTLGLGLGDRAWDKDYWSILQTPAWCAGWETGFSCSAVFVGYFKHTKLFFLLNWYNSVLSLYKGTRAQFRRSARMRAVSVHIGSVHCCSCFYICGIFCTWLLPVKTVAIYL